MSKLYRSTRDKMVTGLCGGLSDTLGIDSTLLRILFLISIPFTGGTTLFIYFIASLVIPKEPTTPFNPYGPGPGVAGNGYYGNGMGPGNNFYGGGQPGHGAYGAQSFDPRSKYNGTSHGGNRQGGYAAPASDLDAMMEDIEKKAMKKELEDLKRKLSDYEKGEV